MQRASGPFACHRRTRRSALLAVFVIAILGVALSATDARSRTDAPATSCPSIAFIGAAGSGELQHTPDGDGVGAEVDTLRTALASALKGHGLMVDLTADRYPAAPVNELLPPFKLATPETLPLLASAWARGITRYIASINAGIKTAKADMTAEVARCPATRLVLAGYSQGAMVMHQAELQLASDSPVTSRIAGTLLLGDGDRTSESRATLFGNARTGESLQTLSHGEGIRTWFTRTAARHDVLQPATTAEICNAGDLVCDFRLDNDDTPDKISAAKRVHTTYEADNGALLAKAANWLAGKIIAGNPAPTHRIPCAESTTMPVDILPNQLQACPAKVNLSGDGGFLLAGFTGAHPTQSSRGDPFGELQWTTWSSTEGVASGAEWADDCRPNCAQGVYHAYRATVRVYDPNQAGVFQRMSVTGHFELRYYAIFQDGDWAWDPDAE
jgi:hypothetical protein